MSQSKRSPAGRRAWRVAVGAGALLLLGATAPATADVNSADLARFADLALHCVHREYPNKIAHVLQSDRDALPPRRLTPAFYGCYDWHSSVHGHWLLARFARLAPRHRRTAAALAALGRSLSESNIRAEVAYLEGEGRTSFERPYGLAWLLQLGTELREWDDPGARTWQNNLEPLEAAAADRFRDWLPRLAYPVRTGEHSQTAFAFGLVLDWARAADDADLAGRVTRTSLALYAGDRDCPLAFEPSGQDFLSPCLAEADLMRRIMPAAAYARWLGAFLPGISLDGGADWLPVARVTDRADPKLAHLDGLNLSRAWMLDGIASALADSDPRRAGLLAAATAHRDAGLVGVSAEYYVGSHWLGSFATYLTTRRGIAGADE